MELMNIEHEMSNFEGVNVANVYLYSGNVSLAKCATFVSRIQVNETT